MVPLNDFPEKKSLSDLRELKKNWQQKKELGYFENL